VFGAGRFGKEASAAEVVGMKEDGIVGVLADVGDDVCGGDDVFSTGACAEVGVEVRLGKEDGDPEFMVNREDHPCFREEEKGGAGEQDEEKDLRWFSEINARSIFDDKAYQNEWMFPIEEVMSEIF
jgi:hypothetical protein